MANTKKTIAIILIIFALILIGSSVYMASSFFDFTTMNFKTGFGEGNLGGGVSIVIEPPQQSEGELG